MKLNGINHKSKLKKIIFLGGLFPDEIKNEIQNKTKGNIDFAADTLQWSLIEGLGCFTSNLRIINLPFINIYPFYSDVNTKTFNFSHRKNSYDVNVGFLNLPFLRMISRFLKTKSTLNKSIIDGNEIVLIYSLHLPFIKAAIELKNKYPSLKVCVIVPDLIQFISEKSRWRILRYINNKESLLLAKVLQRVDGFVVLSDYMHEPLAIKKRPWVRVEGIYNNKYDSGCQNKEILKTILYTGTLARRYGITNLLDAFANIKDDDYRLWICGYGDTNEDIYERAKNDKRIKHFGQIPREEVLKLQRRATVLVNPRTSSHEFTKYSFPSKIMEYLGSGTPSIIHRLPGIPSEYYQYVFVPKDQTIDALTQCLIEICEKDELELKMFGEKAKNFVVNSKSSFKQGEKIYNLIQNL